MELFCMLYVLTELYSIFHILKAMEFDKQVAITDI